MSKNERSKNKNVNNGCNTLKDKIINECNHKKLKVAPIKDKIREKTTEMHRPTSVPIKKK